MSETVKTSFFCGNINGMEILAYDDDLGYQEAFERAISNPRKLEGLKEFAQLANSLDEFILLCDSQLFVRDFRGDKINYIDSIDWLTSSGITNNNSAIVVLLSAEPGEAPGVVHRWYQKTSSLEQSLIQISKLGEKTNAGLLELEDWPSILNSNLDSGTSLIHSLFNLPIRIDADTLDEISADQSLSQDLNLCNEILEASFGSCGNSTKLETRLHEIFESATWIDFLNECPESNAAVQKEQILAIVGEIGVETVSTEMDFEKLRTAARHIRMGIDELIKQLRGCRVKVAQ